MPSISQMSFKNITNNSGHSHQTFQKTVGLRLNGHQKLYSIQGHSLEEDQDNFYVTINKLNNDLFSRQAMIVNRENLESLLKNGHLLVVNQPKNISPKKTTPKKKRTVSKSKKKSKPKTTLKKKKVTKKK